MSSRRQERRSERANQMTSIATRFVTLIRENLEAWRARELDYAAFMDSQQETWDAVRAAGPGVEAEVLTTFLGAAASSVLLPGIEGLRTASLRVPKPRAPVPEGAKARPCRHCYALLTQSETGNPTLRVAPADPHGPCAEHRQVAALIYELAADLERQSPRLGAQWSIVADPNDQQILIHLTGDHEAALAYELLERLITRYELIDAR